MPVSVQFYEFSKNKPWKQPLELLFFLLRTVCMSKKSSYIINFGCKNIMYGIVRRCIYIYYTTTYVWYCIALTQSVFMYICLNNIYCAWIMVAINQINFLNIVHFIKLSYRILIWKPNPIEVRMMWLLSIKK